MCRDTKAKTDVIFIIPDGRRNSYVFPFGPMFISSFLESRGISTKIVDFKGRGIIEEWWGSRTLNKYRQWRYGKKKESGYLERVLTIIKQEKPTLVGFSCFTVEYQEIMAVSRAIKKLMNIPIVVGGIHPTLVPKDFFHGDDAVDFVIRGDGEEPMLRLHQKLQVEEKSYAGIPGLVFRDCLSGKLVDQGVHVESDLSSYPMPDYNKVNMNYYVRPNIWSVRHTLFAGVNISTGRGCPFKCEFCAVGYLKEKNQMAAKMRYRSIEGILDELEYLKAKYFIDSFYIVDDCFMTHRNRIIEFSMGLIKRKLRLTWAAETHSHLAIKHADLFGLMKRSGLVQLDFGVESGSDVILKRIRKQITAEQHRKAFAICREHGIRTFANILLNSPQETREDIQQTHELLQEIRPTVLSAAITVPMIGTPLYRKYVKPELTPDEYELFMTATSKIVDERFRLASDDVNLEQELEKMVTEYDTNTLIWYNLSYFKTVLLSRYRFNYLFLFVEIIIRSVELRFNGLISRVKSIAWSISRLCSFNKK